MAQAAFQNGNPVQVSMLNNQDLTVTPVRTQQLDQHRGMSRFDDYQGR
jgi:antitoxin component of MazEF toxin-antitoxin module